MNFLKTIGLLTIISILITACNEKAFDINSLIKTSENSIFRNINFDADIEEVKKRETAPMINSTDNYLRYEILPDEENTVLAEFEYHFSKNKLDLITVYLSSPDENSINTIFKTLNENFEKKYGRSNSNDLGWKSWEVIDKEGLPGNIDIMLRKDKKDENYNIDMELVKYYFEEKNPVTQKN